MTHKSYTKDTLNKVLFSHETQLTNKNENIYRIDLCTNIIYKGKQ